MKISATLGLIALTALTTLAACGNDPEPKPGVDMIKASFAGMGKRAAPQARLTRKDLASILSPVQQVTIENNGKHALIGELRSRNGIETWASVDDVTISMRNGVILATRGFGADLMAAEVPSVTQLSQGAKGYRRVHTLLTGEDRAEQTIYRCDAANNGRQTVEVVELSYTATKITETCSGEGITFTNEYWLGADSLLRKSRQWISPDAGYLTIADLRR